MVGLDVGTFKIGVVVAEVSGHGVEITGIGTQASTGLKKGTVVNIDAHGGGHPQSGGRGRADGRVRDSQRGRGLGREPHQGFNSHGVVAVRSREVAGGDVERVLGAARAVALPTDGRSSTSCRRSSSSTTREA